MINRFDDREAIERVVSARGDGRFSQVGAGAAAWWHRLEQILAEHPKQSLIAALTAGAVLGWIIKRR